MAVVATAVAVAVSVAAVVDTVASAAVVSVDMLAASVVAALAHEALALEASATASRTQRREAVSGRLKATVFPAVILVTASAAAASTMAEASIEASSPAASGDRATTMITGITRTMPTTIPTMTMAAAMSCNAVCIRGTVGALGRFKSAADGSRACGKEQLLFSPELFFAEVNADHPEEVGIYERLKRRLATEHQTDREDQKRTFH